MKERKKMKKNHVLITALFLAVSVAANITGCGKNANVAEVPSNGVQKETADAAEGLKYPIEVTDSDGNKVVIESEPETIVSVAPNLTEIIYELDAQDKLVARSDYCDYPSEVSKIDSVGTIFDPDIEKIVSLNPDLVVVSTHFNDENSSKLESLGITVLTLREPEKFDDVYTIIETMGLALNRKDRADEVVKKMKSDIENVKAKVEGSDIPSVYYVVGYGEYGDFTMTGDSYGDGIIEAAGARNIAKEASGWMINLETIIEADPDIIILNERDFEGFTTADNYKDLTAVKEGKVYTFNTDTIDRPGVRNDEAIIELAKICHPEAFE